VVVLGPNHSARSLVTAKCEGMAFSSISEVEMAYRTGQLALHAMIKVRIPETVIEKEGNSTTETRLVEPTAGRALLFHILPKGLPLSLVAQPLRKKASSNIINRT